MIATHNDQDHFGGLLDLLDIEAPENRAELDC
jgi:beta-lactamase superfamily II metal-dependent hydrolase